MLQAPHECTHTQPSLKPSGALDDFEEEEEVDAAAEKANAEELAAAAKAAAAAAKAAGTIGDTDKPEELSDVWFAFGAHVMGSHVAQSNSPTHHRPYTDDDKANVRHAKARVPRNTRSHNARAQW